MRLFAPKTVAELQAEAFAAEDEHSLRRGLSALNPNALGIGAIIGVGIFVLTGQAAAQYAGPAISISFVLAGAVCAFAGFRHAESSAMIPIAGSAYTYGYATLGELVSIGTLLAFVIVRAGVLVLRVTGPEIPRPLRTPGYPFVPLAGMFACGYLMYGLPPDTWARLIIWMAIGLVIYALYGRRHSTVQQRLARGGQ